MQISELVKRVVWLAVALIVAGEPAWSQNVTLESLNGKQVTFAVVYNVSGINPRHGPFSGAQARYDGNLQISGSSVSGSFTRTVTYQGRNVGSLTGTLSGAIGRPKKGTFGGEFVWVLQGNSLIALRTFTVGGMKITITFRGGGCSVRAPMMHEMGAGSSRGASVSGGQVVVTSAMEVSSTCSSS